LEHDKQYNSIAALYDTCISVDFDVPFFLGEAQRAGGPVLELMCGSGRVSVPLLDAGVPLTCLDFSSGLLKILERKLAARGLPADLVLADVRELALPRKFDLIFVPFHSFTEVSDLEDEQQVLQRVAGHLSDEGRFICTLHNPAVRLRTVDQPYGLWIKRALPDELGTVLLWGSQRYAPDSDLVTVLEFFERYAATNVLQARHMVELTFRLLSREQFGAMAERAGFVVEALYGNYDRAPYDEAESPFMIWILRKATA
jgi:ubiquinone/menaquinone biosynthesis C-methylase UbiE